MFQGFDGAKIIVIIAQWVLLGTLAIELLFGA